MNRLLSVRARITAVSTVLVAAALIIISVFIVRLVENDVRQAAEESLNNALQEQAENIGLVEEPQFFEVVVDGTLFGLGVFTEGDDQLAFGELFVENELLAVVEINLETQEFNDVVDPFSGLSIDDPLLREELEALSFDILDVDGDTGAQFLVGATTLDELDASTSAVRRALTITVPLLVLGFALLTWWLVGRSLRPVNAITARVMDISTKNLHERVPQPAGRDEVSQLATVMNQMLTRLEHGDEKQRQFSADASHELRSPLSTVRAAAEMIELKPAGPRTHELAGHILASSDRMDGLIGDLLELSRLEEATGSSAGIQLDLSALARTEIENLSVDSSMKIESNVADDVLVVGHPGQLTRLLRNLVDNAKRHAATTVRVHVQPHNNAALITVADDGPGIPEDDRSRVFERFTRLDEGRSRSEGGSGLGLSLVTSIVDRHAGTVEVDSAPELGGARFRVQLPLSTQG